ncbi:unnamed protein product [Trichobilharzia regenti]|nr:unnamed protein product [Trichobilharzia regenti]
MAETARHFCLEAVSCNPPTNNITPPILGKSRRKDTPAQPTGNTNLQKVKTPKATPRTSDEDVIAKAPLASAGKHGYISKTGQSLVKSKVADSKKEDKQPETKPKSEVCQSESLVLFNVPVCINSLPEQRAAFDQEQWSNLCNKLGPNINSSKLYRLYGGVQTPQEVRIKKIEPPKSFDVISLARSMNEDFAAKTKQLFNPEVEAVREAIRTGTYIAYRPTDKPWDQQDCQRVCSTSRCFCGHLLNLHETFTGKQLSLKCQQVSCSSFNQFLKKKK